MNPVGLEVCVVLVVILNSPITPIFPAAGLPVVFVVEIAVKSAVGVIDDASRSPAIPRTHRYSPLVKLPIVWLPGPVVLPSVARV